MCEIIHKSVEEYVQRVTMSVNERRPNLSDLAFIGLALLMPAVGQAVLGWLRGTGVRHNLLALAGLALIGLVGVAGLVWIFRRRAGIERWLAGAVERPSGWLRSSLGLSAAIWLVCALALPVMMLSGRPGWLQGLLPRAALFWWVSLLAAACLRVRLPDTAWTRRWGFSTLALGMVFEASKFLPQISNDPFTLGWSEASRYYYASLFLASRIYGHPEPLSVLHPSRYLLQAVPFLVAGLPIWVHRLWQVVLWLGATFLGGWVVARRIDWSEAGLAVWASLWLTLFFFQGAVYFHLMVAVILVIGLFRPRRFWAGLGVVALGTLWAGISRVNWIPVPGMLAVALYALERPREPGERFAAYWARPAAWAVAGVLVGFVAQAAYVRLSGNPPTDFGTAFSSSLLWYRLLPNATFPAGILLALAWACLPLGLIAGRSLRRSWVELDSWRMAALAVILLALLGGGLLVSVKIGGGGDLHNLDAFLVAYALIALFLGFDTRLRRLGAPVSPDPALPWWMQALLVGAPLIFVLSGGSPWTSRPAAVEVQVLAEIRQAADAATAAGRPVLFLSERQLLTFGQVSAPDQAPAYEKVTLMEMAMADNQPYLAAFYRDIFAHRFGLIVSEPLVVQTQGREHAFGEENNAWSAKVAQPVLCAYLPVFTSNDPPVQLLVPRESTQDCSGDRPGGL